MGQALQVTVKYSPNVEMAASLNHLLSSDPSRLEDWAQTALKKLTESDVREAREIGEATGAWGLVMDLFCYLELVNLTDTVSFLRDLDSTDDVEIAYGLLSGLVQKKQISLLLDDPAKLEGWHDEKVEQVFSHDFAVAIIRDCASLKHRLSAFLQRYWDLVFADVWQGMGVALMEKADDERAVLSSTGVRAYLSSCHPALRVDETGLRVPGDFVRNYPFASLKAIDVYVTTFLSDELMLTCVNQRLTIYKAVSVVGTVREVTPSQVFKFLKAISSETRMQILRELRKESKTTKELSEELGMAPSTISVHLKIMRDAELVYPQRMGSAVYNRFLVENYRAFLRYLTDYLG